MKNTLIQICGDTTKKWQVVKPGLITGAFMGMEKTFPSVPFYSKLEFIEFHQQNHHNKTIELLILNAQ